MPTVLAGGTIEGLFTGAAPTYSLIDTGMKGFDNNNSLALMLDYIDSIYIGPTTTGNQSDHSLYFNMPSPWQEVGFPAITSMAMVVDVGLAFSVNGFSAPSTNMSFSDKRAMNNYSGMNNPTDGGFFIAISNSSSDVSGSYKLEGYSKGMLLTATFDSRGTLYVYSLNTGEVYFFHTATFNASFGTFAKGSNTVLIKGACEPLKIYSLRAKASTAFGVVEDAVGGVAANCIVYMFRRSDGKLLGRAVSNSLGQYEMITSAITGDSVFMVCLDNDAAPDFEGLIYDRVTV